MAMSINTNVVSLNAQRNLSLTGNSLGTTMQRLSSGLRVNSAKDDAAGLAIAERMNAQSKGLSVAARNANDGISLAQTAEGALGKMGDMLQRMRELAVQSSNATNSTDDRKALQSEVHQLRSEIDRVAKTTSFNGTKILDGSFAGSVFQVGASAGDNITVGSITNAKADALSNVTYGSNVTATVKASSITNLDEIKAGPLSLRIGSDKTIDLGAIAEASTGQERLGQVVAAINNKTTDTGVTAFLVAGKAEGDYTVELRSSSEKGVSLTGFTTSTTGVGRDMTVGFSQAHQAEYKLVTAKIDELLAKTGLGATAGTIQVSDITGLYTNTAALDDTGKALAGTEAANKVAAALTAFTNAVAPQGLSVVWAAGTAGPPVAGGTASAEATTLTGTGVLTAWKTTLNQGNVSTLVPDATRPVANESVVKDALTALKTALGSALESQQKTNLKPVSDAMATLQSSTTANFATNVGTLEGAMVTANLLPTGGKLDIKALPATGATAVDLKASMDMAVANANSLMESGFGIKTAQVTVHKGMDALDVGTQSGAWEAIKKLDSAIDQVNSARGALGALQTRFEKTVENIDIMNENVAAARGRIVDADFAAETANLSRSQILQQAGTAMVAQANQLPQSVLSLLR